MKVWLDDIRPMPAEYDTWVRTVEEAVDLVESGQVTAISLDNDLGTKAEGYQVLDRIEELAFFNLIPPMALAVHSSNGPRVEYMQKLIPRIIDIWDSHNP